MDFKAHSHRHGLTLFNCEEPFATLWTEIANIIDGISDHDIVELFERDYVGWKSISGALNELLKDGFVAQGWTPESPIFADPEYNAGEKGRFRLDFAKDVVSVEVAFNHGEAAAWNLLKPALASELNHIPKAIDTQAGVIITATEALKDAGGFDSAVGTYEKYLKYLRPLNAVLPVPLVLIGLEPPRSFRIVHFADGNRQRGTITRQGPEQ